eukprot:scaffold172200_cov59-Attheya_sp.AAC.1
MAAPASGHWTFGIIVGNGLGLGVGLFMRLATYTGLRTVDIKTTAPTKAPVPPTTVTTDVTLTVEVAPATAALEAAIFTSRVVVSTVLSMRRNSMACAINSLYQRVKYEKESKSEQSTTKHAVIGGTGNNVMTMAESRTKLFVAS